MNYLKMVLNISLLVCFASAALAQPGYTVADLGTLPGDNSSYGFAINTSGQVTGYSDSHNFLYSNGTGMTQIPCGYWGINDSGQVAGSDSNTNHACVYSSSSGMTDLGTFPGGSFSAGLGINASGQVTGDSDGTGFYSHAFLYSAGTMTDLGTLSGGSSSYGTGINASGQVTGGSDGTGFYNHAFLYSSGTMTDLGTFPGGTYSVGQAINASGQVTGYGDSSASYGATRSFLYSPGSGMQDLGTAPGENGGDWTAHGINSSGQVVGDSSFGAFLYSDGTMTDLNTLLPANSGWKLVSATAINDSGQITGLAIPPGPYAQHAVLLTPAPIVGQATPAPVNGWNNTDVTVSFRCSVTAAYPNIDVSSCSGPTTLTTDGSNQSVTGTVMDTAGHTLEATVVMNVDKTSPTVTFTGGGTYTVDQTVNITCGVSDALSGIASFYCPPDVTGPAYSFPLGTGWPLYGTATDNAGNVGYGSATLTIIVGTALNLAKIVPKFETKSGVAADMVSALQDAYAAFARGNLKAGDNDLKTFISEVKAQSGKSLTAEQAGQLIQYATALIM